MNKVIGSTWEQVPSTKFIIQCQCQDGIRIVKNQTMPTSDNVGLIVKFGDIIDTSVQNYLEGICWIRSMYGENKDYYYEARV